MRQRGHFSAEAAQRAVSCIESLHHTKGRWAGVPFKLTKWQRQEIIEPLFGTLNPDGTRQYRTAYIEIPRKNGKSELAAAVANVLLFADREMGAEIYGAAADRDQASLVFNVAAEMVRRSPALSRRAKIIDSQKRIVNYKTNSFYRAIPADVPGSWGFDAHGVIFDELHAQAKRDLWDALTSSGGTRSQPLTFAMTTAGYDRNSICWEQHEYARQVIDGTIDDPTFFAVIYAAPEDANWQDERVWKACNPALGDFRSIGEMRMQARRAEHSPAMQNTFRRLYLNQWTQQESRWIDLALWQENAQVDGRLYAIDEDKLRGRTCYGGLDLGSVSDLTAWVMIFPHDDSEEIDVVARFWCPEAALTNPHNRYRAQYAEWVRLGLLRTTPGEATDYAFVRAAILDDAAKFRLVDMNVDRLFQAHQLASELAEEGLTVAGMGQGFMSMAAPMAEFMRRLLLRLVHHGGNPCLDWQADNVAVRQDPAGSFKPDKAESQGRIDGIVALVMALDRLMRHEDKQVEWAAV